MSDAARAWANERGLALWGTGERICRSCDCNHEPLHEYDGGAILPTFYGVLELCWECLPVPGSPLANWEYWSPPEMPFGRGANCILCGCSLAKTGGSYMRGGPFCWECPRVDEATYQAWLLRLRDEPEARPPWAKLPLPAVSSPLDAIKDAAQKLGRAVTADEGKMLLEMGPLDANDIARAARLRRA